MKFFSFLLILSQAAVSSAALVHLEWGDLDPQQERGTVTIPAGEVRPILVQFSGTLKREDHHYLRTTVRSVQGYIPDNTYLVTASSYDLEHLRSWKKVTWIGAFKPEYKLSKSLKAMGRVQVTFFEDTQPSFLPLHLQEGELNTVGSQLIGLFELTRNQAAEFAQDSNVQFIEPVYPVSLRNNTVRGIVQSGVPGTEPVYALGVHGEGQVCGLLDNQVFKDHISFSDVVAIGPSHRKIVFYGTTPNQGAHGTHTAGTMVGDGGLFNDLRGVAYMAKLAYSPTPSFSDSASYNAFTTHHNQGARVHSNSWGNDGTTNYEALCRGIDRFLYDNEDDVICFASTNTSTLKNPENAKNLIAVGATEDTPNINTFYSGGIGPTVDGRRKPEIFSPGRSITSASFSSTTGTLVSSGTSMACPSITGSAALLRQYLLEGRLATGNLDLSQSLSPSGALIKAMLINSTVDMTGVAGYPSNQEGWGRILLDNVLVISGNPRRTQVLDVRRNQGLATGESRTMLVENTSNGQPLKFTMAFCDAPATASTGSGSPVIDNFNLTVTPIGGAALRGNVFSGGQSTTGGVSDAINNLEVVQLNSPAPGVYRVTISAAAVNSAATNGFAVAASGLIQAPTVSGNLTLQNCGPATGTVAIDVLDASDQLVGTQTVNLGSNGLFSLELPGDTPDQFKLSVKVSHWLRKTTSLLTVGTQSVGTLSLVNGDADENNEVGPGDFDMLNGAFGKVTGDVGFVANADFDCDGEVGPSDFTILVTNFGMSGD